MRTLYIPTTTLNFNNILSSESISPSVFYGRREFGYKNWHKIEENPFDNCILLYDKMPMVNRPASDYDDYPLVFAVSVPDETVESMRAVSSCVFQYDKTVYLNPYSTTIIFASENHKRIAISKSESSAETKMIRLYQNRMLVARLGDSVNISNIQDTELNAKAIEDDKRINRMKGLLYGYFIGAALSMNSKDVEKLNILNEIKNVFAAILASLNGRATQEQINQLQVLFKRLERFDPKRLELEKILADGDASSEEKIERIMALFERYAYDYSKPNFYQLVNEIQAGRPEYGDNKAMAWINQAISNLISSSRKNKALLQPSQGEIFLSNMSLTAINSKSVKEGLPSELYRALINEVFSLEEFNGKISTFKQELATAVTLKAKEIYGEQWNEKCVARNYLNALRRHVAGESFETQWNSGVLSAVASVILKGDDWEKLLEFLRYKGVDDYRLAFSIYGTLNGFANLTRDFTDLILDEANDYVKDVYIFFHQQLFGETIEDTDIPECCIVAVQKTPVNIKTSSSVETTWEQDVLRFCESIKSKAKDWKEKVNGYLDTSQTLKDFLKKLPNTSPYKKIREKFEDKVKETGVQRDLFESNNYLCVEKTSNEFVDDVKVVNFIMALDYIPANMKHVLIEKVISFQKDYMVPNGYYIKDKPSPRTNDNTIKHFINKCTYSNGKKTAWIQDTLDNKRILDQLKEDLYRRYAN